MKRHLHIKTLGILCVLLISISLQAQNANVTYQLRTDYITSIESAGGSDCWEWGTEEYTANVYANDEGSAYQGSCFQCDRNGNCDYAFGQLIKNLSNSPAYNVTLRLEAFEDDGGGRCSYNSGDDDCRYGLSYNTYKLRERSSPSNGTWAGNASYGTANHTIRIQSHWRYSGTANQLDPCGDWKNVTANSGGIRSWTVYMEAGKMYSFRTCGASDDTYLRLYGANGYTQVAANDDNGPHCSGRAASLNFTPGSTGYYYLELARYTREPLSSNVTLGYKMDAGDPSVFGNNVWNVYAYNGRNRDNLGAIEYAGVYVEGNLNIVTTNRWGVNDAPSNASGYVGCAVSADNHTYVHKRRGFPCGYYELRLNTHDDEVVVDVNGGQVFVNNGCCVNHGVIWSGILNGTSTVEVRVAEGVGGSQLNMSVVEVGGSLAGGSINGNQMICPNTTPTMLGTVALASGGVTAGATPTYQWEQSTTNCSSGFTSISGATGATYTPGTLSQTTYFRRRVTDACSDVAYSNCVTVNMDVESTDPTIAAVTGLQCPNTSVNLMASGGVAGAGSSIEWYTGPNGTGTYLGSGASISVAPSTTTTYYARREGTCNSTTGDDEAVTVRSFIYTPLGTNASANYCTDDNGWHHFFNGSDEILFSINGDLSGATATPVVTIENNNSFYQRTLGAVGSCANGWSPGEEQFEMQRSWNVDFTGTLNGTYNVRYYFPASEKTAIETAAANFIAANPACNYTYKYPNPNGFFWFKNVGSAYVAPQYDLPTQLSGSAGNANGINYSEITGITSFSGGAGGVVLIPSASLPVELLSFTGWNEQNRNVLQWVTETELNNARFEIERSINPQDGFTTIGSVEGAGNSTQQLTYLFEDNQPMLGVNYYRLRQVDFDGTFTYSKVIAIEVEGDATQQVFFPNPTTNAVTYQFTGFEKETLTIEVFDVLGKQLSVTTHQTFAGINSVAIDFQTYVAGTYMVVVTNASGEVVATEKIVKKTP